MDETETLARKRFTTLNMVRLGGAVFAVVGVANIGGKLLPSLAPWLGIVLLLNGIFDVLLLPNILRKSWAREDGRLS